MFGNVGLKLDSGNAKDAFQKMNARDGIGDLTECNLKNPALFVWLAKTKNPT